MRVTFRGLVQAATVLTVLFSVITIIPADNAALQLFTHFRVQYLAASLLLLVVCAALREPRYALALFFTAVLNGSMVIPWYNETPVLKRDGRQVTILLANVRSSNQDHDRFYDLVELEQPEVLVLLEVSPDWARSLTRLDATYPHRVVEPRAGNFGIAVYSKRPMTSSALVDSAPLGFPSVVANLDIEGTPVYLVATHPMIPLGSANYDARNKQLNGIARLLQRADGARMLVGDLNMTMWDLQYDSLENKTWLRNARLGAGILPTWPTFLPFALIPIDHIMVSEEIEVIDIRTGPRIGSDHLPLIATLTL